jgi:hypothetical protein
MDEANDNQSKSQNDYRCDHCVYNPGCTEKIVQLLNNTSKNKTLTYHLEHILFVSQYISTSQAKNEYTYYIKT